MSLEIKKIVLHQLIRKNENEMDVLFREALLENNQAVSELIIDINRIYNNKSKAYGLFNSESIFASSVQELQRGNQDFLNFSQESVKLLRNELIKYPFAEGGTVVFCYYQYLAVDYLLVAVLNSCNSMLVDEQLDISMTRYLDLEHADIIARLDVTDWQTDPSSKRYLTFLKGRVGRKVSDFFMDYLGASEGLDTKAQNRSLVQAVDDYCQIISLDKTEKQEAKQQVYDYCQEQLKAGEEIALQQLARELPADEQTDFSRFVSEQDYALDDHFPADRAVLRQLKKFTGSGGGVTIGFEAELLGDKVQWDPQTDTLTIKGTPPNLRDQLQRSYQK